MVVLIIAFKKIRVILLSLNIEGLINLIIAMKNNVFSYLFTEWNLSLYDRLDYS